MNKSYSPTTLFEESPAIQDQANPTPITLCLPIAKYPTKMAWPIVLKATRSYSRTRMDALFLSCSQHMLFTKVIVAYCNPRFGCKPELEMIQRIHFPHKSGVPQKWQIGDQSIIMYLLESSKLFDVFNGLTTSSWSNARTKSPSKEIFTISTSYLASSPLAALISQNWQRSNEQMVGFSSPSHTAISTGRICWNLSIQRSQIDTLVKDPASQ